MSLAELRTIALHIASYEFKSRAKNATYNGEDNDTLARLCRIIKDVLISPLTDADFKESLKSVNARVIKLADRVKRKEFVAAGIIEFAVEALNKVVQVLAIYADKLAPHSTNESDSKQLKANDRSSPKSQISDTSSQTSVSDTASQGSDMSISDAGSPRLAAISEEEERKADSEQVSSEVAAAKELIAVRQRQKELEKLGADMQKVIDHYGELLFIVEKQEETEELQTEIDSSELPRKTDLQKAIEQFNELKRDASKKESAAKHPSVMGSTLASKMDRFMRDHFALGCQYTEKFVNYYESALNTMKVFSEDQKLFRANTTAHFKDHYEWYKRLRDLILFDSDMLNSIFENIQLDQAKSYLDLVWNDMKKPQLKGIYALHLDEENNLILASRNAAGAFGQWYFHFMPDMKVIAIDEKGKTSVYKDSQAFKQAIGIDHFVQVEIE